MGFNPMSTQSQNPLTRHFRRPAIHFKLPSNGRFWRDEDLVLPATGELPIMPMTAADEVSLKTPDGLMNGSSVVEVIESCCPSIKNAWNMPTVDVDATLIAIRIASYGSGMDVTTTCPHCGAQDDYSFNLVEILDQIHCPDYTKPVEFDGLKIKLRPQTYKSMTQANLKDYEEQRIMMALTSDTISEEERNLQLKSSVSRVLELNDALLLASTESITDEDGEVISDRDFIGEYYKNAPSTAIKTIRERLDQIAKEGALPISQLQCNECHKAYELPLVFDYSSFFDLGS